MKKLVLAVLLLLLPIEAAAAVKSSVGHKKNAAAHVSLGDKAARILVGQVSAIPDCDAAKRMSKDIISADVIEQAISSTAKRSLEDLPTEKGEYQTTAEFTNFQALAVKVFFGMQGRVAFKVPVSSADVNYDADAAQFTVQLYSEPKYGSSDRAEINLGLVNRENDLGHRRGATAMGVKFNYELWSQYNRNLKLNLANSPDLSEKVVIEARPDQAIAVKNHMYFMVFGDIAPPFREQVDDEKVASLDDPNDTLTRVDTYTAEPACIFLFNDTTGQIYHTFLNVPPSGDVGSMGGLHGGRGVPTLSKIQWVKLPDLNNYYPQRAQDDEVDGSATVLCEIVDTSGQVKCSVASETPAGYGFGDAVVSALEANGHVDMSDKKVLVGSTFRHTMHFQLGG